MKPKTQKAALCSALLNGETLSIMDGFRKFGITNIPREVSRAVEDPFDVKLKREEVKGKNRYGGYCNYVRYSLPVTKTNRPGIRKMKQYLKEAV